MARGVFGSVDQLPSGRYRAMYYGPDRRRYKAPTTFTSKKAARGWLSLRQSEIIRKAWEPPEAARAPKPKLTFGEYAESWLATRDLKDRTRAHHRSLLDRHLLKRFGTLPLTSISADEIRQWHSGFGKKTPTQRCHTYGLLRTILRTAVTDGLIDVCPANIRGAGSSQRVHKIRPATLPELEKITLAMPERLQAMVLMASWCGLRLGELTELRRADVDLGEGVIRVRRAVVRVKGEFRVTTPKSQAGIRDVNVPPHLLPAIAVHMASHVGADSDALLFPARRGGYLHSASLYWAYYPARAAAGRKDLRWHDLRHTGAVLAAATGATLAELMARLGHSTPGAAMRYQHAAQGADKRIALALSALVEGQSTYSSRAPWCDVGHGLNFC